jgi:anaerobic selenocysteine-containing dehydrogenase
VRGPERILDAMLRAGPYGDHFDPTNDGLSLAKLQAHPHGIDLGPLAPRIPEVLTTETGSVELAPSFITADVARLRAWQAEQSPSPSNGEFLLVGRRHTRSNNSWMHNVKSLAKGRDRCTLLVHPDDAKRIGLGDGQLARVRSRVGELTAPVALSDEMMPGVVSLPHGYGHDANGARMRVAAEHAGVNSNLLSDELVIDELSGNSVLNGVGVEIAPVGAV